MTFEEEYKYIVLKLSDARKYLSFEEKSQLSGICKAIIEKRIHENKNNLSCVVVESDWPEYESTRKAIKRRVMAKESTLTELLTGQKEFIDNETNSKPASLEQPWLDEMLKTIESAPFDEAEQIIAFISKRWLDRMNEEDLDGIDTNPSGYRAAIKFASKLKIS